MHIDKHILFKRIKILIFAVYSLCLSSIVLVVYVVLWSKQQ